MFATIIVVLPSQFTGGAAHLSHSGLNIVYDCSEGSSYQTTVMAWYTDVTHEIKPITSGYRLVLAYNLVHTTTSVRPALTNNEDSVQKLREILLAWQQDEDGTAPEKVVYLLTYKYSQANLRASALKGADAHRVAILDMLAKELDFHLGLASVVCTLSGCADDEFGDRRRRSYSWDESGSDDEDNVAFGEVEEVDMTIEGFVDLEGSVISSSLGLDDEEETIPTDLSEILQRGKHDRQEYEGYLGNV